MPGPIMRQGRGLSLRKPVWDPQEDLQLPLKRIQDDFSLTKQGEADRG